MEQDVKEIKGNKITLIASIKKQAKDKRKADRLERQALKNQRRLERLANKETREGHKAERTLAQLRVGGKIARLKEICDNLKQPKTKSASPSPKEIKYNISVMLDFVNEFGSHKDFMAFLNLIPVDETEMNNPYAVFIREYRGLMETNNGASYPKIVRYMNYTSYQHSYMLVALYNNFFGSRVKKYDRVATIKGIPGWAMKNDEQRKEIIARRKEFNKRTDLHHDIDLTSLEGDSLAQAEIMEGRRDELVNLAPRQHDYEYSIPLKDSYVNTFIINLVKMKRTKQEVSRTYGVLQSYAYKYARYGLSATKEKASIRGKINFLTNRIDKLGVREIIEELTILEQYPILAYNSNEDYKLMNRNLSILMKMFRVQPFTLLKKNLVPDEAKPIVLELLLKAYKKAVETWKESAVTEVG